MLKKIKEICLGLGVFGLLAAPVAIPLSVSADNISNGICSGINSTTGTGSLNVTDSSNNGDSSCSGDTAAGNSLQKLFTLVVNIFSVVVGFIAVVMIIFGGVKYITSGGDSGNVSGAKNTIVFAIVGLVIVALAQVLVRFVLAKASTAAQ